MKQQELMIEDYSFADFLLRFQEAVVDGYRLDLESNERFPQKFGDHLTVTVVQPLALTKADDKTVVVLNDLTSEIVENSVLVKRQRKSKADSE